MSLFTNTAAMLILFMKQIMVCFPIKKNH